MKRAAQLERLRQETFDVLVIGGGATGAGTALDAVSRGLKTALVERDDFSAGTSSRSTKLIHGGVRYLEQAVKKLDATQFNLVKDALRERATLIRLAPHLAKPLPILTPLYNLLQIPYMLSGLKLYDALAGRANLKGSRFVSRSEAIRRFPMLKKEGLRGAVLYYDGQFDDARMNVALVLTAAGEGAAVANHLEVTGLLKEEGRVRGAAVRDTLTDNRWDIQAKVVVNATGPFSDAIRKLDDEAAPLMLTASSGVHIVLGGRFSPPETGLLIPQTDDGRVLFLLPWLGYTLFGTTDNPARIEANPGVGEGDIDYLLSYLGKYFDVPATRDDVLSSWSGLRPLVSNPKAADTARLSRDHVINTSASGLVTIAGGKWTTYRKMALDTVDEVLKVGGLQAGPSRTEGLQLVGAAGYTPDGAARLEQQFGLEADVAAYLNRAYGDRADKIAELSKTYPERLVLGHPHLAAEVIYSATHEGACTATDFLARRTRLVFLDQGAALQALPKVVALLAETLSWDEARRQREQRDTESYLNVRSSQIPPVPINAD
jgi:glycerol-3-phosphate dehydrogenase